MTAFQKQSWYTLGVIAITLVAAGVLYPYFGQRAAAAFSCLALLGFVPLFYWQRSKRVVFDERDQAIYRQTLAFGCAVAWIVFVVAAMLAQPLFGDSVPVAVVQNSIWIILIIVYGVQSIAALISYARVPADAS